MYLLICTFYVLWNALFSHCYIVISEHCASFFYFNFFKSIFLGHDLVYNFEWIESCPLNLLGKFYQNILFGKLTKRTSYALNCHIDGHVVWVDLVMCRKSSNHHPRNQGSFNHISLYDLWYRLVSVLIGGYKEDYKHRYWKKPLWFPYVRHL